MGSQSSGRNTTAERAIEVLLLFDLERPVLSATEIGHSLQMSRSTTYRYIQSLRSYGLLEEDDARGGYRLGPRILQLARIARSGFDLPNIALPIMRRLVEETGELVFLMRRSGNLVLCIERVEPPERHHVRLSYERGQVFPLGEGAAGGVLLAWGPADDGEQARMDAEQLAAIRRNGYAATDGAADSGERSIAAPIFGADANAIGAVGIAAPIFRVGSDMIPTLSSLVLNAAKTISARLSDFEG
jgi:DNA-binding IclR family transcriptional regulator